MALVIKDRIKETATTTGTGTFTLGGAVSGFQAFSEIGDGNTTYYCIEHATENEFEVGLGTYTLSGTTLARTTIITSSNAGNAVNFSAGDKNVFVTVPATKTINKDASDNIVFSAPLEISTSSGDALKVTTSTGRADLWLTDTDTTAGQVRLRGDANNLVFITNTTERGRVDGDGRLLIGKTTNAIGTAGHTLQGDGFFSATRSAAYAAGFNRLSDDGEIVQFFKDGTAVGSIGSRGSGTSFITLKASSGSGSGLTGSDNAILPMDESALADNNTDLGSSSYRFKDLYVGGNIFTDSAMLWNVSAADSAHQRADARDDGTNFSRLHWYGVRDNGTTSNFRHAWYDGSSYINVTAASGQVGFGGDVNVGTHSTLSSTGQLNIYRAGGNPWIGWYSASTTRGAYTQYIGSTDSFLFGDASYVDFDCNIRHEGQYNYNDTAQYIWWTGQTYGNFRVGGGNVNGYSGIEFDSSFSDTTLMIRNSDGLNGFYRADAGSWFWYSDSANHFRSYGNVTAYASDERLKTFHGKVESSLEKICQIDGLYYEWDEEACSKTEFTPVFNKMEIGLKAQQVEALFPEVVELAPFDTDPIDKGVDQSKSGENYLTLHYERLVPVLIEAIKELNTKVDMLKE